MSSLLATSRKILDDLQRKQGMSLASPYWDDILELHVISLKGSGPSHELSEWLDEHPNAVQGEMAIFVPDAALAAEIYLKFA